MTAKEFAARIGGRQRGRELTEDEKRLAKDSGLVVVYGASDDTMIIDGALDDDVDCFDGGTFHINRNGLVKWQDDIEDGEYCEDCPYFKAELASAMEITAVWHDKGNPCWTYKTDIPHEEFAVYDDDEPDQLFCIGIVFSLSDLGKSSDWTPVEKELPEHRVDVFLHFTHNYAVGFYDHEHEFWGVNTGDGMFSIIHEGEPIPTQWKSLTEDI